MKTGQLVGLAGALAALSFLPAACTSPPPPEVPTADVPPAPTGSSTEEPNLPIEVRDSPKKPTRTANAGPGTDKENPVMRCGPRDSYAFVADYQCSDGDRPLGGDVRTGAASRRGNVGANGKGHIIDLYIVPCSSGPVEVFVDMYGCPEYEKMLIGP